MHFPVTQYHLNRERTSYLGVLLAFCILILLAGTAVADEVTNLYEATVPVTDQDKDNRADAIRTAFLQVLSRVSGRSDITDAQQFPAIASAVQGATRFAQQYRYVTTPAADGQPPGLALWVRFDETALGQVLRASHLPVWGSTRPSTLLWLAVDNRGQRELLAADSHDEANSILQERARLRGVPLRLPLLDLTDRTSLNVSDVWGNFESTILQASQRYQTEAVLVGRVFQSYGGTWTGRWSLYVESGRDDWTVTGKSLADVLNPGIDKTAELLAMRYAQVYQVDTGKVLVEVKDIKGLASFNRVVKYLQSISHVTAVQPVELAADSAIFQVTIPGGRLAVARAVSLRHVLAAEPVESVPVASLPAETTAPLTAAPTSAGTTQPPAAAPTPGRLVPDLIYRLVP
ncbi:MAG: DUF2066 domain-containing protein [Gammaproteobacteria bacterium]|nr:DUF2066 domain-containing protein [Gammaproteobacteria bacterium]